MKQSTPMRKRFLSLLGPMLSATLLFASVATGAESTMPVPASESMNEPVNDLRVIVDISGSMKKNDPHNLRAPALRLLIGLLPNGSKAGIWTFGEYVNMQVKHTLVDDVWKRDARSESNNIHNRGLFTNIEGALRRATYGWDSADSNYNRHLILLTDGMVDISREQQRNDASRERIIGQLLPELKQSGVKIHTIALSELADHNLLKNLSLTTSGWYEKVTSVDALQKTFLRIFEKSSPVETVPIRGNSFQIDDNISDMTVLLFHGAEDAPVRITTPEGDKWDHKNHSPQTTWFRDASYTMITMNRPMPGNWHIEANMDPDNRVIVATNVRLKTSKLPSAMLQSDSADLHTYLMADNKILNDRDLLGLMSFNLHLDANDKRIMSAVMHDDGATPDDRAEDGIYSTVLSQAGDAGVMNVSISAEGKTFNREYRQSIKVYRNVIDIAPPVNRDNLNTIKILAIPDLTYLDSIEAQLKTADGAIFTLTRSSDVEWQATIPSTPSIQEIAVNVSGILNTGKPFKISAQVTVPAIMIGKGVTPVAIAPVVEIQQVVAPTAVEADNPESVDEIKPDTSMVADSEGAMPAEEAQATAEATPVVAEEMPAEDVHDKAQDEEVAVEESPHPEDNVDSAVGDRPKVAKTNWWLVFSIVLSVNLLLIGGGVYGYFYWKKRKVKITDTLDDGAPLVTETDPVAAAAVTSMDEKTDVEDAVTAAAMADDIDSSTVADNELTDANEIEGLAQIGGIGESEQADETVSIGMDDVAQQLEDELVALSDNEIDSTTGDEGLEDASLTSEPEVDMEPVVDVETDNEDETIASLSLDDLGTTEATSEAEISEPEVVTPEIETAGADVSDPDNAEPTPEEPDDTGEMEDMVNIDDIAQHLEEELDALSKDEMDSLVEGESGSELDATSELEVESEAEIEAESNTKVDMEPEPVSNAEAGEESIVDDLDTTVVNTEIETTAPEPTDDSSDIVDLDDVDAILADIDNIGKVKATENIDDVAQPLEEDLGTLSEDEIDSLVNGGSGSGSEVIPEAETVASETDDDSVRELADMESILGDFDDMAVADESDNEAEQLKEGEDLEDSAKRDGAEKP